MVSKKGCQQEDAKKKRLVAAAAAYVAVYLRGRVLVDLKKDAVTLGLKGVGGISTCRFKRGKAMFVRCMRGL